MKTTTDYFRTVTVNLKGFMPRIRRFLKSPFVFEDSFDLIALNPTHGVSDNKPSDHYEFLTDKEGIRIIRKSSTNGLLNLKNGNMMLLVFMLSVLLGSCSNNESKIDKAKHEVTEAKADLNEAISDSIHSYVMFKNEMEEQILLNQKLITEYKTKIAKGKKQGRNKEYEMLEKLEEENFAMRYKIDNYRMDNLDRWNLFKQDFSEKMSKLNQSIKKAINVQ